MKPLVVKIDGDPFKQDRPRVAVIKGHAVVYDKKESKEGKKIIAEHTALAMAEQNWDTIPIDQPVAMVVTAYFSVPKSWPKQKRADALAGKIRPTSKPDVDNIQKIYMDGLVDGGAMQDDASVVESHSYKYYAETPSTVITLDSVRTTDG